MRWSTIAKGSLCLLLVIGNGKAGLAESKPFSCYEHSVKEILDLLGDQKMLADEPQLTLDVMNCLGWRRVHEAIPVLVKLLTWRYTFPFEITGGAIVLSHSIYTGNRYPATEALVEIGKPTLPALLKVIEGNAADSLKAKNARYTVHSILTNKGQTGEEAFVKDAAAKASNPEAKERLLKVLETAAEDYRSD